MVAQLTRRCNKWLLLVPIALLVSIAGVFSKVQAAIALYPIKMDSTDEVRVIGHTGGRQCLRRATPTHIKSFGIVSVYCLFQAIAVGSTVWLFRASQRKSELLGH
ncbi:MAG: hypothetical protein ACYTXT_33870 [Nostoc sp.]